MQRPGNVEGSEVSPGWAHRSAKQWSNKLPTTHVAEALVGLLQKETTHKHWNREAEKTKQEPDGNNEDDKKATIKELS